ncbi:probable coenzyme F420-dependent N5,N10-methylene tetrahydromethanopterin reductase and related flavin-dependent oxidoreductases [Ramularia collo-cygni]|uniref:Probable coenzyme F420-dependent N5,N10-methylene tetrahydromethanopterin reductase and related flavin-dependent oxidoreductases n=1 Tax=Ramularia collo-cygni TaxID=112498 RepID=A0A2D3VLM4_9PEZI|nr:probable coenzyme F420-dependent N5,N10-methylene tetrahydromethanopterin reductase and related flavin-dependent oxidoreductases [Ramularia collo-cygni]CZT25726.1 probable coenzyme F420-dependent N5,N10-methylene tetrahydromethanopterin reductase and related flavin-dependent oxidoreductases [Ramularia collo-cygni]
MSTPQQQQVTGKKPWVMNAFAMAAPGHLAPGLWRHPDQEPQTLEHWIELAKKLDEAKFHGIFFADVLGIYDVYQGNGPALSSGAQIPHLDVSYMIAAMAAVTKNISFGITASTSYEHPYTVARKYSTLDHLTNGRVGWNIVTSYLESAAKSFGLESTVEHDERYNAANEFMEVVYKLLEGSWEDDAVEANKATGIYTNPEKVHAINHAGKYFKSRGPNLVHPSPQRTPFLLQAGASKAGKHFAASHAEAMFLPGMIPEKTRAIVDDVKKSLIELGRAADSVKFIAGIFIAVDETDEKAQAKFQNLLQYADLEGTASLFGGWTGTDLSTFTEDEDFQFTGPPAIQSMITAWTATVPGTKGQKWTKKTVLEQLAISGAHPRAIGSAETVADIMEHWVNKAGVDGFNISYATTPGTFDDLIKYLWPELKKRGVLQTEYHGSSMRENYLQDGRGPRVREGHPARKFRDLKT